MRVPLFLMALLMALTHPGAAADSVRFASPLDGQQVVGSAAIDVTTDLEAVDRVEFTVDGALVGVVRTPPFRIVHDFGTSLEPHVVTARVIHDGFRKSTVSTIRTGSLVASAAIAVDLVEVPLRVRGARRAIAPSDLVIRENNVVQTISEIIPQRPPATFTFVVDRSLSMSDGKLDAALAAIGASRPALREGDRAEVIFFNHTVSPVVPVDAINREEVPPSGGTSLRDALLRVADDRRTIVIVITDGNDRNSFSSEESALRALSRVNLTVHALFLGRGNANGFVEKLAARSGGSVVATSPADVARDLRAVFDDINSRYVAVYQSRGTARGWRAIHVGAATRGLSISGARKGYFSE